MDLGKLYLKTHPEIFSLITSEEYARNFEDDLSYTPYRKFQHQIYGKLDLFRETSTNRIIMSSTESFDSFETVRDAIAVVKARETLNQPSLLYLIDFAVQKRTNFCSTLYLVTKYLEFPLTNLSKDIRDRKTRDEFYSHKEIGLVINQMLSVLANLYEKRVFHGNISTFTIQHRKANQMFVLLDYFNMEDDLLEFHQQNTSLGSDNFNSPELHFNKNQYAKKPINGFKNDIFSLAMVVLSMGLLSSVQDCYLEKGQFDWQYLDTLKMHFEKKYGGPNSALVQSLRLMLQEQPAKRQDAKTIRDSFRLSLSKSENERFASKLSDFSEISAISAAQKNTRSILKNFQSQRELEVKPLGNVEPEKKVHPVSMKEIPLGIPHHPIRRASSILINYKYDNFFEIGVPSHLYQNLTKKDPQISDRKNLITGVLVLPKKETERIYDSQSNFKNHKIFSENLAIKNEREFENQSDFKKNIRSEKPEHFNYHPFSAPKNALLKNPVYLVNLPNPNFSINFYQQNPAGKSEHPEIQSHDDTMKIIYGGQSNFRSYPYIPEQIIPIKKENPVFTTPVKKVDDRIKTDALESTNQVQIYRFNYAHDQYKPNANFKKNKMTYSSKFNQTDIFQKINPNQLFAKKDNFQEYNGSNTKAYEKVNNITPIYSLSDKKQQERPTAIKSSDSLDQRQLYIKSNIFSNKNIS